MTLALAIHGGCGVLPAAQMTPALDRDFRAALRAALEAGWVILELDGSALDATEAAVAVMEDCPLFNAGHGAVFNAAEGHELDAAIMDGATLRAGAICAARHTRNPIKVARAVMERTDNLLLAGEGADAFAASAGFAPVPQSYFSTAWRRRTLDEIRALAAPGEPGRRASEEQMHGTVGAVARDRAGHLAAATSTGGFTGKALGRVGDTPIVGAGTYADDATCAISATGRGEFFVRKVLAHEIAARMKYGGRSLEQAAAEIIHGEMKAPGWDSGAGLVGVERAGNVVLPYNTEGMYRGFVTECDGFKIAIYAD
ncbi:MAG: isoaspartyl peptidase/L-asparaginase family protein [Pseudomonadota bacterium]